MKDDPIMKEVLKKIAGIAQYCSLGIQNELVDICRQLITEKIADKVKSASFFTILVNEKTSISRQEQMAIGLRFLDSKTFQIREEFVEFAVVEDLRGESLGQFILIRIEKLGLDMKLCRGQGYPLAKYIECLAQSLSLVLTDRSKIHDIKHCMMIIRETVNFFHFSAKQSAVLKTYTKVNLKVVCETRWVERHDAI
ncbi:hypothetical protein QYM36_018455 [Artemia franciscana]|uniref:DUF4371 domain-containing protein n=1 Tax=Artemia franciscana TaxID=6661 RepID=A0AA88H9G0_ARTSF|nr:hypothetical protein QYM36_018455 [Artemia franciscana]